MSTRQRHSTGNLNNTNLLLTNVPKKGILKRRPHTFHQTRQKSTGLIPLLLKPIEKKGKIVTTEEEQKEEMIENKDKKCLNERRPENEVDKQQFIQKIPQRVEFAEKNAVFGDTTDTEGLNNSKDKDIDVQANKKEKEQKEEEISTKQKRERKKEAIVSPLIRQQQIKETTFPPPPLEQPTTSTKESIVIDEDDKGIDPSIVAQIIGKWWCPNDSHEREQKEDSQYQENEAIKKELRHAQMACKEKDRHLNQLRERLAEIETIVSSGRSAQLAYCAQLNQRLAEREIEFTTEMDGLIASHEHRVRQLKQEIVDLRVELARKERSILTIEQISRKDQTTQTDNILITEGITNEFDGQKDEAKIENAIEVSRSPTTDSIKSTSQTVNIQTDKASVVKIGAEVVATLDAYRNEAAVWRTRCANLELIMQDLLLREGARRASENGVSAIGSALFINVEGDTKQVEEENKETPSIENKILRKQRSSPVECQIPGCIEKKKKLFEQNNKLTENVNKLNEEINTLIKDKKEEESKLKQIELNSEKIIKEHEELAELAEKRGNDAKAVKLTLQQSERDNLKQAIAYLERRCYALEQLGLEHGIVLVNEPTLPEGILKSLTREELEFNVRQSKETQTALTVDDLGINERTMDELQIRIRVMQSTFAEDKASMREQLEDIERILKLKTELTNTLTNQLNEAAKREKFEDDRNQSERDLFRRRIEELGKIAERVPILESEIEKAMIEKSRCELRLRDLEESFNDNMEKSLEISLKREKAQERYWSERIDAVNRKSREISAQLEHEKRRAADERLKWAVEKADLERRLTSAIEHIEQLFSKLNCPRRDVQCEVRPRTSNKYVFCRPNQHDQQVDNADLRDEQLEQLVDERVATLAAELLEKQQHRRKTLNQPIPSTGISAPDFLKISFQRKGGLVEFGGSIPLEKLHGSQQLFVPFSSTNSISIASLPTNLGYQFSEDKAFMVKSCEQLIKKEEEEDTDEEDFSKLKIPRHLSLPHNRLIGSTKSILRSHSAPRRQEVDRSIKQLFEEQIEQSHFGVADKLREQVKILYEKAGYKEELFDQLNSWLQALAENEKYCYELKNQNLVLKRANCDLRGKLKDAELELWIYRTEPRREALIQNSFINKGKWKRSCSAEQLGGIFGPPLLRAEQLKRWKEMAGTCFREVNHLRKRLTKVENDRLSQIGQLSILKGELAMAKCQAIHSASVAKFAEERGRNSSLDEKWKSVPELDETEDFKLEREEISGSLRIKKRRKAIDERDRSIVSEALRRQFTTMKEDRDRKVDEHERIRKELKIEQNKVLEMAEKLKQIVAECGLLRRENSMYEQKCVEMDRDRQKMYLVMFRKGQQAANQKLEEEMDEKTELQVVLNFLHDAFFYYLLSKGSAREHLQAIMTMLNFTAEQKDKIYKQREKSLQL